MKKWALRHRSNRTAAHRLLSLSSKDKMRLNADERWERSSNQDYPHESSQL